MPIKERHWNSLVTGLRHAQCVLVLGPELPCLPADGAHPSSLSEEVRTISSALAEELMKELEQDGKAVSGSTLPIVAQNYEDAEGFGQNALRSTAARYLATAPATPCGVLDAVAALPFPLILTTCQDASFATAVARCGKQPLIGRYHFRGDRRDNPELTDTGLPQTPLIYHLFGNAEEPNSLVLSENDLLDFLIAVVAEHPPL